MNSAWFVFCRFAPRIGQQVGKLGDPVGRPLVMGLFFSGRVRHGRAVSARDQIDNGSESAGVAMSGKGRSHNREGVEPAPIAILAVADSESPTHGNLSPHQLRSSTNRANVVVLHAWLGLDKSASASLPFLNCRQLSIPSRSEPMLVSLSRSAQMTPPFGIGFRLAAKVFLERNNDYGTSTWSKFLGWRRL